MTAERPAATKPWDCTTDGVTEPCGECAACKNELADRDAAYRPEHDPLHDAIAVLSRIDLAKLSAHPETEDAGNRVAVALGYLREATKASEPRFTPWERLFALLRGDTDV